MSKRKNSAAPPPAPVPRQEEITTGMRCRETAGCPGHYVCLSSHVVKETRVKSLVCNVCLLPRPARKWSIPLKYAPRRAQPDDDQAA